jgi:protease I
MAHKRLKGMRVAVLAADGFEQVELTQPRDALTRHGAEVEVVSLRRGSIQGMNLLVPGRKVDVDRTVETADAGEYDALLIPGGFVNPDLLRQSDRALSFVRMFERAGKPIGVICHGPWVLISAGLVQGRRLASWPGIQDDVRNAGGAWEDEAVVHDRNWVSSRGPQDLPAFNEALVGHFAAHAPLAAHATRGRAEWRPWLAAAGLAAAAAVAVRRE